jgi:hypothetical protein
MPHRAKSFPANFATFGNSANDFFMKAPVVLTTIVD